MHYCNKCLGTIPNHLPDQKVCSRCVAEDEREAENKRLREIANRRIKALNELLVCYRIGRQPSERLFKELKVTEKKWSKLEGGGD